MKVTKVFRITVEDDFLKDPFGLNDETIILLGEQFTDINVEEVDLSNLQDEILGHIEYFDFPIVTNESYPAGWWLQSFGKFITQLFYERKQTLINGVKEIFRHESNRTVT